MKSRLGARGPRCFHGGSQGPLSPPLSAYGSAFMSLSARGGMASNQSFLISKHLTRERWLLAGGGIRGGPCRKGVGRPRFEENDWASYPTHYSYRPVFSVGPAELMLHKITSEFGAIFPQITLAFLVPAKLDWLEWFSLRGLLLCAHVHKKSEPGGRARNVSWGLPEWDHDSHRSGIKCIS